MWDWIVNILFELLRLHPDLCGRLGPVHHHPGGHHPSAADAAYAQVD